jgi:predicted ATPase
MELLERETFLESLATYGDEALLGQGRAVLIAGEAGVGKTALLEAFHERLRLRTRAGDDHPHESILTPRGRPTRR